MKTILTGVNQNEPDGAPRPEKPDATVGEPGLFDELAGAEIKLAALFLNFPQYKRCFTHVLQAPIGFFGRFDRADAAQMKAGIAFMLQGITLAFVIFTMGWALPQSIASFSATNLPLIVDSSTGTDLNTYAQRIQAINEALPTDLARAWRQQGELILATRILPAETFAALLSRLETLAVENPELLSLAIDGSLTHGDRFGGRSYILLFFLALDAQAGPLLHQTHQLTYAGPQYKLKPHVDFLLRTVLLWLLTCAFIARLTPGATTSDGKRTIFLMGAYLVGFLTPIVQGFNTLLHFYLAFTLPAYIDEASELIIGAGQTELGLLSGGVFPFENLMLAVIRGVTPLLFVGLAIGALAAGIQRAGGISTVRAWIIAGTGIAAGLGLTEGVAYLLVLILAPTGLL